MTPGRHDANLQIQVVSSLRQEEGITDESLIDAITRADKAFFEYGFSKSQRANITADEGTQFKKAAKRVLALTDKHLAELLRRGDFVEVESE